MFKEHALGVWGVYPHYEETLFKESQPLKRNRLKRKSIGMFNVHGGSEEFTPCNAGGGISPVEQE